MASRLKSIRAYFSPILIVKIVLFVVVLYLLIPQLHGLRRDLPLLRSADLLWVVLGLAFVVGTYIFAATIYCLLALKPIRFLPTLSMQLLSNFMDRLLPAGTGAIGVNIQYLRHERHSTSQATAVVFLNNCLGLLGHLTLLTIILATGHNLGNTSFHLHLTPTVRWIIAGVLVILLLGLSISRKVRKAFLVFVRDLKQYKKRPDSLFYAFCFSLLLTGCYMACLFVSAEALHIHLTLAQLFVTLSLTIAGATISPTPGGLGGAEAALTASLIAFRVANDQAFVAAVLYRVLTYWLPLFVGGAVFLIHGNVVLDVRNKIKHWQTN